MTPGPEALEALREPLLRLDQREVVVFTLVVGERAIETLLRARDAGPESLEAEAAELLRRPLAEGWKLVEGGAFDERNVLHDSRSFDAAFMLDERKDRQLGLTAAAARATAKLLLDQPEREEAVTIAMAAAAELLALVTTVDPAAPPIDRELGWLARMATTLRGARELSPEGVRAERHA